MTCKKTGKRENKYSAVPKRKNARIFSMTKSQFPALGIKAAKRGFTAKHKYGTAMPSPMHRKTSTMTKKGWVSTKPKTPPSKGPLQGVAKIVVRNPLNNASSLAFFCSRARKLIMDKRKRKHKNQNTQGKHEPIFLKQLSPGQAQSTEKKG